MARVEGIEFRKESWRAMKRLGITAKIWLSIGVFGVGYVLTTVLGQIQGLGTESTLRITSEALFPAAQRSQEAESAFQQMVKGFSDAVMVQDASGLAHAGEDGRRVVENLNTMASVNGLAVQRCEEVRKLAASVEQYVNDAKSIYGAVLANPANMTADVQERMKGMAARSDTIKASLQAAKEQATKDLHDQLSAVQSSSARQRWLELVVFGITLVLAGVIVNLTIRRTITGPILRVIQGVQEAAEQAGQASSRMAESGQVVARDSQDQAASIEETSAALEQISVTTRENASRAGEADRLMRSATGTVNKANQAMNDLQISMSDIAKSSKQVSDVLKSIDEIAFQTNVLALNAAVEAARAGESGAGFSVVADEVRSLAQRAADAARRSGEIIEKTMADVTKGVKLVGVAHGAFTEVSATIAGGSLAISQIATSSDEQSRGISSIGEAISRIQSVTQSNASNAHQTAEAAENMSTQVETTRRHLQELVEVVGLRQS